MKSPELSPVILVLIFLLAAPLCLFPMPAAESDGYLTVGAVQFAVSRELYSSSESFRTAVESTLDRLEERAADIESGRPPDLAVFPEYTSAFLGLSYLSEGEIRRLAADPAGNRRMIKRTLSRAERELIDIWSEISRERGYYILAGSALIVDSEDRIRNRALLFSPEGTLVWTQDKVFPGAPELRLLNLKTGSVDDVEPFEIDGVEIVTTICRDTYNPIWEDTLPDAELWIDIKANELPYSQEYYSRALPARLPESPIDAGLTVSLAGEILGFQFTGPVEYLDNGRVVKSTDPYTGNKVILISLPTG